MKNLYFTFVFLFLTVFSFAQGAGTTNWTTATPNATETVYTQDVTIPGCAIPITVTLTLSGTGADNVNTGSSGPAGTGTSNRLNTNLKFDNPSESLVWTVTFSAPVTNVNFTIWQVDRSATSGALTFQDKVTFAGSPTITAASGSAAVHTIDNTNSTVTGINNISSTSLSNSPKVDYGSGAISGFSFTWNNGPDITGSAFPSGYAGQTVGLGAINMTRAACPMPVTLVSFVAKKEEGGIALNWETSSETNSDYFDVQKSNDAKSFETFGRKQAVTESSDVVKYSLTDKQPVEGWNYYRLKMVDKDGSYSFSRIAPANYQTNENYLEILNGNDGYILVKTNLEDPDFNVFDDMGRNILMKTTFENGLFQLFVTPKNGLNIVKAYDKSGAIFTKKVLFH